MTSYRAERIPQVEIKGRPNARAKRMTLRHDVRGGGFTVSYPRQVSRNEIQHFIDEHSDWIAKHHQPVVQVEYGADIPFRGMSYKIAEGDKRGVYIDKDKIAVKSQNPSRAITAYFKTQAQLFASPRLDHYTQKIGRPVTALRWRDPKTRWGSCDSNGVIMLSWRLIMAPDWVFEYVIAHEVAHLIEMNHSDRFWAIVEEIYPDQKRARNWLRKEGKELQSISF